MCDAKDKHMAICKEMNELYQKKNCDYGDSFHNGWKKYGMIMAVIRLGDKFSRLESLTLRNNHAEVSDESVRDTLIDLANYAVMTVMELDSEKPVSDWHNCLDCKYYCTPVSEKPCTDCEQNGGSHDNFVEGRI